MRRIKQGFAAFKKQVSKKITDLKTSGLTLSGYGSFTVAGFLLHEVAGFVVAGIALLLLAEQTREREVR